MKIIENINIQQANFDSLSSATIQSYLFDNNTSDFTNIHFKDPWYLESNGTQPDSFHTFASPHHPTGAYNQSSGGVFLNQNPNFLPDQPVYSLNAPDITSGGVTYKFINYSGTNVSFQSSASATTPVVFTNSTATVTANYKATLASNTSTAMNNPSQQKIVRTGWGTYFLTYESGGKVWAEYSNDSGSTWNVVNQNYIGTGGSPSLSQLSENDAYLVYSYNGTGISFYHIYPGSIYNYDEEDALDQYDATHVTPVVSYNSYGDFIVLWRSGSGGLHYSIGKRLTNRGEYYTSWVVNSAALNGTNGGSYTPTVQCESNVFEIAWQQVYSEYSSNIKFTQLTRNQNGTYSQGSVQEFSSGYSCNYGPSLIATNESGARITWIGYEPDDPTSATTVFTAPGSPYWYFGWEVSSAQINGSPGVLYDIGWVNGNGTHQYVNSHYLSNPHTLSINGNYVQLSNGTTNNNLSSLGFNTSSSLYRFNISSSGIPYYKTSDDRIGRARGGMVTLNNAQFTFLLGDISADGGEIGLVDMPDTVKITGQSSLNSYLETNPFSITSDSKPSFGIQYWTADSAVSAAALGTNKNIKFRVELVNADDNTLIAAVKTSVYSNGNIDKGDIRRYELTTDGITASNVKLRLVVNADKDANYALVNKVATGSALAKGENRSTETVKMKLSDVLEVTSYALEQNYPNPFNPSTTIAYQLPKDGMVTITVYDVLGKEVAELVHQEKRMGRYTALFDGSNLASGTYIVRMVAQETSSRNNQYVKTMKIMMVK